MSQLTTPSSSLLSSLSGVFTGGLGRVGKGPLLLAALSLVALFAVQQCRLEGERARAARWEAEAAQYQAAHEANVAALEIMKRERAGTNKILAARERERNASQTELVTTKERIAGLSAAKNLFKAWADSPLPADALGLCSPDSNAD